MNTQNNEFNQRLLSIFAVLGLVMSIGGIFFNFPITVAGKNTPISLSLIGIIVFIICLLNLQNDRLLSFFEAIGLLAVIGGFVFNGSLLVIGIIVLIISWIGLNNIRHRKNENAIEDLQHQQIELARRLSLGQGAPPPPFSNVNAYSDPFADRNKAQMKIARDLIVENRFSEARAILVDIDHPTAKDWIAKIDKSSKPV